MRQADYPGPRVPDVVPFTVERTGEGVMKAVAVVPGEPESAHLAELPMPRVEDVPAAASW